MSPVVGIYISQTFSRSEGRGRCKHSCLIFSTRRWRIIFGNTHNRVGRRTRVREESITASGPKFLFKRMLIKARQIMLESLYFDCLPTIPSSSKSVPFSSRLFDDFSDIGTQKLVSTDVLVVVRYLFVWSVKKKTRLLRL